MFMTVPGLSGEKFRNVPVFTSGGRTSPPGGDPGGEAIRRRDKEGNYAEGRGGSQLHTVYRSIGTAKNPVKNNLSICINITDAAIAQEAGSKNRLTVATIDYNVHVNHRLLLMQDDDIL